MGVAASKTGEADSFQTSGLTFGFQQSMNVHPGTTPLLPSTKRVLKSR